MIKILFGRINYVRLIPDQLCHLRQVFAKLTSKLTKKHRKDASDVVLGSFLLTLNRFYISFDVSTTDFKISKYHLGTFSLTPHLISSKTITSIYHVIFQFYCIKQKTQQILLKTSLSFTKIANFTVKLQQNYK